MLRFQKDLYIAPLLEALLILIAGLAGWALHSPLIFASLGPTAYELVETPERPSARPYNIIVGNLIAVAAGFLSLLLTHAWFVAAVSANGVPMQRIWAGALAVTITVFGTLLVNATQPAAMATSLLISLGIMQTLREGLFIMVAVVLMVAVGEPVRRLRERNRKPINPHHPPNQTGATCI